MSTKAQGDAAEDRALAYLQGRGLQLAARNYRTPGRGGGEIDLVLWDREGTLVFVEVRKRSHRAYGGAAGSVTWAKQRRIVLAARHYLLRLKPTPPCRFDVISMEGDGIQWMRAAFDAG
jgi:putative endonuclease